MWGETWRVCSSLVPADTVPCPFTTPSINFSWNWPVRCSQPSPGLPCRAALKAGFADQQNRSQPASLPKSCQHLQMVPPHGHYPICLGWPPHQGAIYWRWKIRKTFLSIFYPATGPCGFQPCRSSSHTSSYLPTHLCPCGEQNHQWQGSMGPHALHLAYSSENTPSSEALPRTFLCLGTRSCMWSQRQLLSFIYGSIYLSRWGVWSITNSSGGSIVTTYHIVQNLAVGREPLDWDKEMKVWGEGEAAWGLKSKPASAQQCGIWSRLQMANLNFNWPQLNPHRAPALQQQSLAHGWNSDKN